MEQLITGDELKYIFSAFLAWVLLSATGCGVTSEGLMTTGFKHELNRAKLIDYVGNSGKPLDSYTDSEKRQLQALLGR